MSNKKNTVCYGNIIEKIKELDLTIKNFKDTITNIKDSMGEAEEEEICIDEVEADRAALNAIKDICMESLLEQEPEGEA